MGDLTKPTGEGERVITGYDGLVSGLVELLASARSASARAVNAVMTATYWESGAIRLATNIPRQANSVPLAPCSGLRTGSDEANTVVWFFEV